METRDLREDDLRPLLELEQELWRQDPLSVSCGYGQIAFWSAQAVHREHRVRLWYDGPTLVGWGWATSGGELEWQVRPEQPELLDEILAWGSPSTLLVPAHHVDAIRRIEAYGLVYDDSGQWIRVNERALDALGRPPMPDGYRVRSVEPGDFESRAAAHRSAFHPSRFRDDVYDAVRRSAAYRSELDCVVEAPDGSVAAYALAWLDDVNAVGELEPVGTHADHQRLGLGRAVCLFALGRLRDAGGSLALVACRGDAAYPIPCKLYESIGFREWTRTLAYSRP